MLLRYLCLICLLCVGSSCFAQEVTIRVVSENEGRPLQHQPVTVSLLYGTGETPPATYEPILHLQTDANGEVRFEFPVPAPANMSAQVRVDESRWHCGCGVLVVTEELIRDGVVAGGGKSAAPLKASPGEILFVVRPVSFWEWLMSPLEKG
jgi:hypothetical protein